MKKNYKVMRMYEHDTVLFHETEDFDEAYDTAYEYVWAMGGTTQLHEYKGKHLVKVTQFESEGYIDEELDVVVDEKVILQLI